MNRILRDLLERMRYVLRDHTEANDLREEMEEHIAMEADANERRGMSRESAMRAARKKFGSADRFAEETRDASGVGGLLDFMQDVKHALRGVRRSPGFAAVAVFTLAVGIGVATAVFSIADHLLFRPVPSVAAPNDLAYVQFAEEDKLNYTHMSYPNLMDMIPVVPAFSSMMAYGSVSIQAGLGSAKAEALQGHAVAGDYFGTLGVTPQRGRLPSQAELSGSADSHVAVISDDLWKRAFSGMNVLGRRVRFNALTFTIIGVAPAGFHGPSRMDDADIWVPGLLFGELRHMDPARMKITDRDARFFPQTVGRLAPGATIEMARQQLHAGMARLISQYTDANEQYKLGPVGVYRGLAIPPEFRETYARMVRLLCLIAAFVLIVACANVANLLLFRAVHTRGESAVRRALGASNVRVLQHFVAQGAVFGVLAAIAGVMIGSAIIRVLADTGLPGVGSIEGMSIDGRVMLFAIVLGLATSIAFAVVPTLLAQRLRLVENLRESARTETSRLVWLRRALVVTQLALAAALVVPGIMLANTVRNLTNVDLGFDVDKLVLLGLSTDPQGYDESAVIKLRERLLTGIRGRPEITSAALTNEQPLFGYFGTRYRGLLQGKDGDPVSITQAGISRNYFETLGIPIISGRSFNATEDNVSEADVSNDIVINRAAALKLFGGRNPIGETMSTPGAHGKDYRVIGVVGDKRSSGLRSAPQPAAFRPVSEQWWRGSFYIAVRARVDVAAAQRAVREVVAGIDPNIPFFRVELMSDAMKNAMQQERLFARLASVLAMLSAVLAGIGLYGLMAYAVARRSREIGVRMALGAQKSRIVGAITGEAIAFAIAGSIIGWFGGLYLSRLLQSMFFGVTRYDMWIYAATAAMFVVIAAICSAMPARAAAGIQPASALRAD